MITNYKDLDVHKMSYDLAMDIFWKTKSFPKEEVYSLTSQVVRSSRSISANVAEGWAKREYENHFKSHLINALGSTSETENWLMIARDCKYLSSEEFENYYSKIISVSKMLTKLHQNWKTY